MTGGTTRAQRFGKRLGSFLGAAMNIATGYVWARHGIVWAFAVWGGVLVAMLAMLGALRFPKERA